MSLLSTSIVLGQLTPDLLQEETLADIFHSVAETYPDHVALYFKGRQLTYRELDQWSDAVAGFLLDKGIGRGQFVGVWWPRGIELHVVILGIVKSGAAYVPVDRDMPEDRVLMILDEVKASACFTDAELAFSGFTFAVPPFTGADVSAPLVNPTYSDDIAYVLYTSGSTGKPKGIAITQRNICHFIRAEQSILGIRHDDRVYQGFSVSFDMWCEETWIGFLAGATLFIADNITSKLIDDLDKVLSELQITVLHAVPSLLSVMNDDIPTLRLINAGGEACTPQVRDKWARAPRIFFNSYGPTETTVTATIKQLAVGEKITIGAPLPNYNLAVVDEAMNPLPRGEKGELVISGPGVGVGYINRPDLTTEKFLLKPAALIAMPGERIYRTGDAAIIKEDGSVEFQGRIDDQVKLRGYRIELGEIEVSLDQQPGVAAAAVALKKDGNGQDALVGYVLLKPGFKVDEAVMKAELEKNLPLYMIPATIVALTEMPRLPSGKIDRKKLPVPQSLLAESAMGADTPVDRSLPLDQRVIQVLKKLFPNREVSLSQDFFTDLGGHSLLAATLVSRLRNEAGIQDASIKDIYTHRPLQAAVEVWNRERKAQPSAKAKFNDIPRLRYYTCALAQTIALFFIYGFYAIQIFFPYLGYYYVQQDTGNHGYALIAALLIYCFVSPFFAFLSIVSKWLIIGRMKEGDYPLWGTYYFRWWLVKAIQRLTIMQFINSTPIYNVYLRRLGVKVAPDAQLSALTIGAEDLVTIGADASLSSQVVLNNAIVEDGLLKLRRIYIGDHAYIGSSSVVAGNTTIEDWGELQDLSHLAEGSVIRRAEIWNGSPAQLRGNIAEAELKHPLQVSRSKRNTYKTIFSSLLLVFPVTVLLPLLPTIVILNELDNAAPAYDFSYLVYTPFLTLGYVMLFALITIVLTRLLLVNIVPGRYPVYSFSYVRKWLADQLLSLALIVLHPIYATVYVSMFFRALGAKVGDRTEISTASNVTHTLLDIGEGSFIADAVSLGEADVRGQELILERTSIGNSSFVGNSALIPQGYDLPDNMLVGVLSTPPSKEQIAAGNARDFFGSPAIALPHRQPSKEFPSSLTMTPSFGRKMARGLVELVRILIPETVLLICSVLFIAYAHDLIKVGLSYRVFLIPFYYLYFIGLPCFLVTVALKWLFVGRYKEGQHPMWTWKVWRSEAMTTTYEALAVPFFLEYLKGTAWLPVMLRLLGIQIGKRVWMNTTDITEYDMVSIGDDTALNDDCGPQTHLFEDRVMKIGSVKIGSRSSVGARSIVLYDSVISDDVNIAPLSLVMKGESLPGNTEWIGSPVRNK